MHLAIQGRTRNLSTGENVQKWRFYFTPSRICQQYFRLGREITCPLLTFSPVSVKLLVSYDCTFFRKKASVAFPSGSLINETGKPEMASLVDASGLNVWSGLLSDTRAPRGHRRVVSLIFSEVYPPRVCQTACSPYPAQLTTSNIIFCRWIEKKESSSGWEGENARFWLVNRPLLFH